MKLPAGKTMGVQSLGRQDIGAPSRQFDASQRTQATVIGAIDSAAKVGQDVIDMRNKYDVSQADAHVVKTMSDLEGKYAGAEFIGAGDEVLQNISFNKTDEFGKKRTQIPSHEVYPQLYKQSVDKALNEGSKFIRNEGQKGRWQGDYQVNADKNVASVNSGAMKAERDYNISRQRDLIANMFDLGQYDAAKNILNEGWIGSDLEKDGLIIKANVSKETTSIAAAIETQDVETILAKADQLSDLEKPNALTDELRLEEATKLRKIAKIQSSNNSAQLAHVWVQSQTGMTYGQKLRAAKNLPDAGMSNAAVTKLRQYESDRKSQEIEYQSKLYDRYAEDGAKQENIPPNHWNSMTRAQRNSLQKLEVSPEEDIDPSAASAVQFTFLKMDELLYGGDKAALTNFLGVEYYDIVSRMNPANRNKAKAWRDQADKYITSNIVSDMGTTIQGVKVNAYNMAGVDKDSKQAVAISDKMDLEVKQYKLTTGKNPDSVWMNNKAKEIINLEIQAADASWYDASAWFQGAKKSYEVEIEGVPPQYIDDYAVRLDALGVTVSEQTLQAISLLNDAQREITPESIQALIEAQE